MDTQAGRRIFQGVLVALSVLFLALAAFAGLMHEWHRLAFISLAGLDNSLPGTLAFLMAGFACWIWAGLLSNR